MAALLRKEEAYHRVGHTCPLRQPMQTERFPRRTVNLRKEKRHEDTQTGQTQRGA